jgi:hypothetical protein
MFDWLALPATPLCWSAGGVVLEVELCVEAVPAEGVVAFGSDGAGIVFEFEFCGLEDAVAFDWSGGVVLDVELCEVLDAAFDWSGGTVLDWLVLGCSLVDEVLGCEVVAAALPLSVATPLVLGCVPLGCAATPL